MDDRWIGLSFAAGITMITCGVVWAGYSLYTTLPEPTSAERIKAIDERTQRIEQLLIGEQPIKTPIEWGEIPDCVTGLERNTLCWDRGEIAR
jgi:hypothetical protein